MNPITAQNAAEVARTVRDVPLQSPGTVRRSLSITQLAAALAKAQSEASGEATRPAVLAALTRNGFAVVRVPCELDGAQALCTLLVHSASGEWVEGTAKVRPGAPDALLVLCGCDADAPPASPARAAQQQKPAPLPTDYAKTLAAKLDAAKSRADGVPLYRQYDADRAAGKVSEVDMAIIDVAFKRFGDKFPATKPAEQQPAGAK